MKKSNLFKKSILMAFIAIGASSSFAGDMIAPTPNEGTANNLNNQQQQQSSTSSVAAASNGGQYNGGNSITQVFTGPSSTSSTSDAKVEYSGTQTLKNVPSVSGPQLTTSNDTCMGSVSGSVNVAGFGVGGGKTYVEENCVMLKNAREFWNMGFKAASIARLCMDDKNKESLEITDFECPQTAKARKMAAANGQPMPQATYGVEEPNLTDPLARQRMGYKPLK